MKQDDLEVEYTKLENGNWQLTKKKESDIQKVETLATNPRLEYEIAYISNDKLKLVTKDSIESYSYLRK